MTLDRRLIEEWLPIAEIGIESGRERTPLTPYPAPNRLHTWWARRPLIICRAAVLASILPAGADHKKFLCTLGIHGDPVRVSQLIEQAARNGKRYKSGYGYNRAFKYVFNADDQDWFDRTLNMPICNIKVLDPTSGGGSMPFEAAKVGTGVFANDLRTNLYR